MSGHIEKQPASTGVLFLAVAAALLTGVAHAQSRSVPTAVSHERAHAPDQEPTATTSGGGLVEPGARFERLATGFDFTEGPAPDRYGGLWFTDVFVSKLYHWSPSGSTTLYREDTNRLNGLYFDSDWNLLGCEWYGRRLIRDDLEGNVSVIVDSYDGKKLNGPNDVWVDPSGGIYFTDPTFGDVGEIEQDGNYVYYVAPGENSATRVTGKLGLPNGVVGTPDGKWLYVTDSAGHTWRYAIGEGGKLSDQAVVATTGGDGMTVDERGNLYLASQYDVWVYNRDGRLLQRIRPPEPPSNVAFGGPHGRTLFITAGGSVYSLQMAVRGALAPTVEPTAAPSAPPTNTPTTTPQGPTTPATITPTETVTPEATTPDRSILLLPFVELPE